jgi:hypothetical protein
MLSSQEEQHDRRETQRNDQLVRQQGGTMQAFAQADAATPLGRFTQVNATTVVGATAVPQYPAAAPHHADPCGPEPALGFSVEAMPSDEALADMKAVEAQGGPAAPSGHLRPALHVEPAGSSPSRTGYRRY